MGSYCRVLNQKLMKLESLLIFTQELREATDSADLTRIDHLMNERQVLMNDIDALDLGLSKINRPDPVETKASELFDEIKRIIDQIKSIDDNALEVLNQSKNAVQQAILTLHQERKAKRQPRFLNIET